MDQCQDGEAKQISTISEAVSAFTNALSSDDSRYSFGLLKGADIARFSETQNLPAFIHLICNSTLLSQARLPHLHFEHILEREIANLVDTPWFIPAALALVELRYSNSTLQKVSEFEKEAVRTHYGLERLLERNHFEYYRSGTTSIIFVSGSNAIKIVRPVYLLDSEVASLDNYMKKYAGAPLSPTLFWAEPTVLVMEWIRGDTLEERIKKIGEDADLAGRLSLIRALGALIGEIHSQGFPHGDLNPRNIIVETISGNDQKLHLIDYGFNYSLTKPVLSAQSYRDSVRYIAPASDDANRNAYLDDLYSLSVIVIDVWFGDISRPAEELLHELAIVQPILAFVIEDALINDPNLRLTKLAGDEYDPAKKARKFSAAIQLACSDRTQATRASEENTSMLSVLKSSPLEFITPNGGEDGDSFVLDKGINRRLSMFRRLCVSVTAVSASLIVSVATDSYFETGALFSQLRDSWSTFGYSFTRVGAGFWEILPGLAICMSFLLLATKYYLAIFSSAAPRPGAGFGSFGANLTMRINSFAYALPIGYCFLLDPKAWPFCASIGLAIVGINNVFTFRMLQKIHGVSTFSELALYRSADARTSYMVFAGWGSLVSWYASGIVMVGMVLVTSNNARNSIIDHFISGLAVYNVYEYLLAACVIGINYFKMQRENCGRLAPKMRALIQRYIEAAKVLG